MKIKKKIKVIFLLPSLCAGGAERVISFVSQSIDKEKFYPILLVAGFKKDTVYVINDVDVIYLNKPRILTAIPSIIYTLNKYKPNIVLSSISHVNTLMSMFSLFFRNTKFIGREATVLSKRSKEKKSRKWSPYDIMPNGFRNLDALICQSQDMAEDMITNYNVPKKNIYIINNPISNIPNLKSNQSITKIRKFITVGRLSEVKGHHRILDILSRLNEPFSYTIIGNGSLKEEIFEKSKELGIYDYITYIPFTNRINEHIAENDMFLQGSYVEGFPNALLESCVVGTPVLAFKAPGGTKEIVIEEVNGFLVDSEEAYLEKLRDKREWDPAKIRASVYQKFNKEVIIQQYEDLFINIIEK